jgi:hypothetical protein
MIRSRFTTPALVVLTSLVVLSPLPLGGGPAFASDSPPAGQFRESVQVTGTGEVSGTPDTLTANFAVETNASTIAQALDSATAAATRMRDTLVHGGIAKSDLQTSDFSIGSRVNDNQAIIGYTVSEGLTAKFRNLPNAGKLMSAAIAAGGDAARLNGASFAIENDAALLAEARKKAFADARQKAELYAQEAGRPLGRVLEVTETTANAGDPVGHFSPAAMGSRLPIEPGQQQVTATVTVEWAFASPLKHAEPAINGNQF